MPILYVIIFIPQKSVKNLFFDGEFGSPYDKKLSPSGESGAVRRRKGFGGADIFLDHSGSTYIIPKLSLYSTGLMPPKVILIRSSLYQ